MLGNKPLTRAELMKALDKPENREFKKQLESDPNPKMTEAIISIVLEIDKHFDSAEEAISALNSYANKKSTSPSLAGS